MKTECNYAERPFWCLLKEALYIGTIGYGGPAVLALAKQRLVHEKHIIEEKDFMDALALSQVLPGAIGVTLMGRIGYQVKELWGAILVPAAFALPSLIFITALSWAYFRFGNLPFVKSLFTGLGAMVVALLANASVLIGKSVFGKTIFKDYKGLLISAFTFTGIYILHFNVLWLILFSGLLGFLFFYFTGEFEDIPSQEGDTIMPSQVIGIPVTSQRH
ncbi:MAG: chromate transporter, partial [Proteobacteria bacterium]|nr:chromate transporter [Pseudomonadota bacterium]